MVFQPEYVDVPKTIFDPDTIASKPREPVASLPAGARAFTRGTIKEHRRRAIGAAFLGDS
jgi:hypothetical protein